MPVIRAARPSDVPAFQAIYADAVLHGTATYELEPPDLIEMQARFDGLTGKGFPWLTAEIDGQVIGYAYAGPFRARPAYRFMVEDSIYLAPEAKGRGVGKALLAALVRACEAKGFRQIAAVIGDGSPSSASVKLHAAAGFAHSGVLEGSGFKHGRWLDTTFMQLPLNGGRDTLPDREPEAV